MTQEQYSPDELDVACDTFFVKDSWDTDRALVTPYVRVKGGVLTADFVAAISPVRMPAGVDQTTPELAVCLIAHDGGIEFSFCDDSGDQFDVFVDSALMCDKLTLLHAAVRNHIDENA